MLEYPTATETVDFDPTEPEAPSDEPIVAKYESSRDYSANAIMERLDPLMDAGIVGGAIYGATYSARAHGYIPYFDNDSMRDVLVARLGALTEEDRMKIAAAIGTLRFEVGLVKDVGEKFRLSNEAGTEIASVLFPNIWKTGEAQYALSGNIDAPKKVEQDTSHAFENQEGSHSVLAGFLERGQNVVSDVLYGRLYESAMYGNSPAIEPGTEDQIILARVQVLSEDAVQREKLDDLVGQLEEPGGDDAQVARALGQLLFPKN